MKKLVDQEEVLEIIDDITEIRGTTYMEIVGRVERLEGQTTQEWIPISEQEPTTGEHVLVTIKWSEQDYEATELDYGVEKNKKDPANIIAWMPLPIPYREGKKND